MTQAERVLVFMQRHGWITQDDADRRLGIRRLAARIHDLRNQGYDIEAGQLEVRNRYGETCRIARYRLAPVANGTLFNTSDYIAR